MFLQINVAKLAKLPNQVIDRASLILESLENNNVEHIVSSTSLSEVIVKESDVEKVLKNIDPMTLSPLEALSTLIELKKLL